MWYINCFSLVVPRLYGGIITMLAFYYLFLFFAIKMKKSMVEYGFSLTNIFPYNVRIFDSTLMREYTGQRKPGF